MASVVDPNGPDKARKILEKQIGVKGLEGFIEYVSQKKMVSEEQAKNLIMRTPELRKIAFILA